jgi:hypothetical protein
VTRPESRNLANSLLTPTGLPYVPAVGRTSAENCARIEDLGYVASKHGVLGPIYRAVGQGLNDRDIAKKLNLTELNVQSCIAWIVHFLNLKIRQDLVLYASSAA